MSRWSRITPRSCQYQVLMKHSPSSFSLLFSTFLSFSFLGRFQINLNYSINLFNALFLQLDIGRHTSRSCMPLSLVLCFMFMDISSLGESIDRLFPCGTRDWYVFPSSTLWLGWPVPLFSRIVQLTMYCQHTKLQVMKSLSRLYRKIALVLSSCWTSAFLFCCSLWTMGLSYAVRF